MLAEIKLLELAVVFLSIFVMVFFLLLTFSKMEDLFEKEHNPKKLRKLSILVPAWNEEKNLGTCLDSLLASDYPRELMEIIVIDDGSKDDTLKVAKKYEERYPGVVRAYTKENGGKARALNFGISKAKGEIIAVLDADTLVEPDAIKKLISHFDNGTDAVVPVAKVLNPSKNIITRLQQVEYLFTAFVRRVLQQIDSVYVTPGTFSMYRAEVLRKIGGFDPDNLLEDQEIAMRMQSYNYKIEACLEANVYTKVPETFQALLKQRERWHRGGLRNAFKYFHLISPRYGDLGILIMPLSILSVVLMMTLLASVFYVRVVSPISPSSGSLLMDATFVLGVLLFVMTLIWTYINLRFFDDRLSPKNVVVYLITYAYFITLVWVISIGKEIVGLKPTWR